MGEVRVKGARVEGGRIVSLAVSLSGLPDRSIDRDSAVRWMRDGHSFIPVISGRTLPALQLVETGDSWVIRTDNQALAEDSLPELPSI